MSEEKTNVQVRAACPTCFLSYEMEFPHDDLVENSGVALQERVWATCGHCKQFQNMDEDQLLERRMQVIDKSVASGGPHLFKALYRKIRYIERNVEKIWDYIDPEE